MKRISKDNKIPDAILTSDWHLREDTPICRIDNYWETQWKKVDFIKDLQQKYDCPILHAGDLFDYWKPSPYLLSETIKHLPKQFYTIYGQHDLPQHNLELMNKSGIYCLEKADKLETMDDVHYGKEPRGISSICCGLPTQKILIWHVMNYQGKKPWPDCPSPSSVKLMKKYPNYDLIVTGDNHKSFVEEYESRLLVNPGSLMRMDADQTDHKPCIYLWYAKTNTVEKVLLPFEPDVISREHIERVEKRNERIEAFVNRLNDDWEGTVSFEENLKRFEESNNIIPSVMNIIYKSIEIN
jgi:DNA repair exonuclease SbcCD nuclease subunit